MKRTLFLVSGVITLGLGTYLLVVILAPFFSLYLPESVVHTPVVEGQPTLRIPALNLQEPVYIGEDESLLDRGVWLKFAERSNPELGGNMIITGHRFNFGLTPDMTKRQSPFFHIEKLKVGDELVVVWKGKEYVYLVSELKTVKPTQVEIEHNTSHHQLTLYTCTLGGSYDGRSVVIALPR